MSVPLIDRRAWVNLRYIEQEAALLLPPRAGIAPKRRRAEAAAGTRGAAQASRRNAQCMRCGDPSPPAFSCRASPHDRLRTRQRGRYRQTSTNTQRNALQKFGKIRAGSRAFMPFTNGGIPQATVRKLLKSEAFRNTVELRRHGVSKDDEEEYARCRGRLDFGRAQWESQRRNALEHALMESPLPFEVIWRR